jgi:hypothetical protein
MVFGKEMAMGLMKWIGEECNAMGPYLMGNRGNGFMGSQWIWRMESNGICDGLDGIINAMDLEVMDN